MVSLKSMSRQQRIERRKKVADDFRKLLEKGVDLKECYARTARKYGITVATVKKACLDHDVKIPRMNNLEPGSRTKPSSQTLMIIADLIRGKKMTDIARERNLTRQRIFLIKAEAEQAGLMRAVEERIAESQSEEQ
jgi:DNA invertase Pin-like site-specific DNA recombinase